MLTLTVSVANYGNRGPLFAAHLGDRLIVASSTQPLLDSARVLLREGVDPETKLVMRHKGSDTDALSGRVGELAMLTVWETAEGPRLGRWRADESRVSAPRIDETEQGGPGEPEQPQTNPRRQCGAKRNPTEVASQGPADVSRAIGCKTYEATARCRRRCV